MVGENQTIQLGVNRLSVAAILFAAVLGSLAAWILVAEIVRPSNIGSSVNGQSASARRDAAVLAARIGLVRGDLWSAAAFAFADKLKDATVSIDTTPFGQGSVIEQAIARAPHNSRLWLILAKNDAHRDRLSARAVAALKMSYYTGSNSIAIVPQRLSFATDSRALEDSEIRDLVRHDIQIALVRKFVLMPALVEAYNSASPQGRQLIEKTLAEFDPSALRLVRSENERR